MSLAVLYVDDRGEAAIDGYAVWQNAIELVFKTTPPDQIDGHTIAEGLEKAHASILSIAAKFLARRPAPESLAAAPAEKRDNVIAHDFRQPSPEPIIETRVAPVAPELPLEVPPQPVRATQEQPVTAKRTAVPSLPRRAPASNTKEAGKSLPEIFNLVQDVTTARAVAEPKRRRSDIAPATPRLPRRLTRIENALRLNKIICLEDGKEVQDLAKHLAGLGMTPEAYLTKWKLPSTYPMKAPSVIQKRGFEYEYDPVRKRMIRT